MPFCIVIIVLKIQLSLFILISCHQSGRWSCGHLMNYLASWPLMGVLFRWPIFSVSATKFTLESNITDRISLLVLDIQWKCNDLANWGLCCQKQVSQTGISNYIPQFTVGCKYTYPCLIPASANKVLNWYGTYPVRFVMATRGNMPYWFQNIKYVCTAWHNMFYCVVPFFL